MIRIAVAEDEPQYRALLEKYIHRFSAETGVRMHACFFADGDELLGSYSPGKYEILLLDIQMERMSGMRAAEEIRRLDSIVSILFITHLAQYALQGYGVRALDFILKPLEYDMFQEKMLHAIKHAEEKKERTIMLKVSDGLICLPHKSILFFELLARKLMIHTIKEIYQCADALQHVEEKLRDTRFFRCHTGYLINLMHVGAIGRASVRIGNRDIPISKHRKKDFLNVLSNYLEQQA